MPTPKPSKLAALLLRSRTHPTKPLKALLLRSETHPTKPLKALLKVRDTPY